MGQKREWVSEIKKSVAPSKITKGWAPGDYACSCFKCKQRFWGDKRAVLCADCAYEREEE